MWLPDASVDVVKVATPPLRGAVPREVEPSLKVTLPVAVEGVTAALRVTVCPKVEEAGVTLRVVAVVVMGAATDSVTRLEVLDAFLASPP